jgi:hypothetical protein
MCRRAIIVSSSGLSVGARAEMLAEQVADLVAADMHAGKDEVIRRLTAELLDELAQVTLHHAVAFGLERGIEMDLLAGHALALDDRLRPGGSHQTEHDRACLLGVPRPVHLATVGLEVGDESGQEFVEPVHGRPFRQTGRVAGMLPVAKAGFLDVAAGVVAAECLAYERPVARVADVLRGVVQKPLFRQLWWLCFGGGGMAHGRGRRIVDDHALS